MLAELSFVFLFHGVELSLIPVEVVVVRLLSQVTHHFSWWIIEISGPSIRVEALTLIARLFTWGTIELSSVPLISGTAWLFLLLASILLNFDFLYLFWSLGI